MDKFIKFSNEDDEPSVDSFYEIGLAHVKRGKPHDAIFYFDRVLAVDPQHVHALINKGNVLGKLGKYEEAISLYDKVLRLKPNDVLSILNKGLALHYLKRYSEAVSCYDRILAKQPNHANTLYHKACTRSLEKGTEDALRLLEKAVRIDSSYAQKASNDQDFELLKQDERFKALVS